jgi:hypothetical protein
MKTLYIFSVSLLVFENIMYSLQAAILVKIQYAWRHNRGKKIFLYCQPHFTMSLEIDSQDFSVSNGWFQL